MRAEYLLFDLLVVCPLVALAVLRPQWGPGLWRPALWATLVGSVPFVAWDVAVVDRHWWFHPDRILGLTLLGLPIEEVGFFVVVPLACLVTWELLTGGERATPHLDHALSIRVAVIGVIALLGLAVVAAVFGRDYTALACTGLAFALALDDALGTRIFAMRRGWLHAGVVVVLTTAFNGYLTARPIVLYEPAVQLGVHVGSIPLEDYAFGLALVWVTCALYQHRRGRVFAPSWLARGIRARFGGYVHPITRVDDSLPDRVEGSRKVAVIGGGLAGLGAAELLSRRGFEVVLFERDEELGGKVAAWKEQLPGGFEAHIEHGFHAFFRHYYNLGRWLREIDVAQRLQPISDYAILARDGRRLGFAAASTTPLLNLVGLAKHGFFRWREVLRPRTGRSLELLLRYDAAREDDALDHQSFAAWADAAALPEGLRLAFTTFARAFFADEGNMSMAELVKSFHFYYLGHDHGLVYDHLDGSYDEALVDPIAARLSAQGVTIRLSHPIARIDEGLVVDGTRFDHVVLAADAAAAARILAASPSLADHPAIVRARPSMRAGQRYAVLRLWIDRPTGDALPPFVITERSPLLDAISFAHRTEPHSRAWAEANGGSVLELHGYAVPDSVADDDVEAGLLHEAECFLAPLSDAVVVHRHLQVRDDFTALHLGMRLDRPGVDSGVPGLWFAGDWVKLPCPAMLMEAAHTSARLAADAICAREGVQGFVVESVPLRGVLAAR